MTGQPAPTPSDLDHTPEPGSDAPTAAGAGNGEPWRLDVELLRVIAAVMVVTIHATGDSIRVFEPGVRGVTYWLALLANEASRCSVPVFFAISGWLLLRRPVPDDAGWLRRRVVRLLVPLGAWSVIYIADEVAKGMITGHPAWGSSLSIEPWLTARITQLLVGPGVKHHLWYLYFAIAITLVVWLVQATRLDRRDSTAYAVAALALIVPVGTALAFGERVSWLSVIWALGYTALGYVLMESVPRKRLAVGLYTGCTALLVALTAVIGYDTWPANNASLLVAGATVGLIWMVLGVSVPVRWSRTLRTLGSLTLGIYLVHPLVLDVVRMATLPDGPLAGCRRWRGSRCCGPAASRCRWRSPGRGIDPVG